MRIISLAFFAFFGIFVFLVCDYYLPSKEVVRIVGTEIKRMNSESTDLVTDGEAAIGQKTRDVNFVHALYPNDSEREYRNEDTRWGFPWYFKFDSGSVHTRAQDMVSTKADPRWVVVAHYGWRIQYFDMFPNAIKIYSATGPDQTVFSWTRYIFFFLLVLFAGFLFYLWRMFKRLFVTPTIDKVSTTVDSVSDFATDTAENVSTNSVGFWSWMKSWFARKTAKKAGPKKPFK